jgi:hypothetical protein
MTKIYFEHVDYNGIEYEIAIFRDDKEHFVKILHKGIPVHEFNCSIAHDKTLELASSPYTLENVFETCIEMAKEYIKENLGPEPLH